MEGDAGSRIDESSDTRGQSASMNEPAEVQNGSCHNEAITLTKDPGVTKEAKTIMLKEEGRREHVTAVNLTAC